MKVDLNVLRRECLTPKGWELFDEALHLSSEKREVDLLTVVNWVPHIDVRIACLPAVVGCEDELAALADKIAERCMGDFRLVMDEPSGWRAFRSASFYLRQARRQRAAEMCPFSVAHATSFLDDSVLEMLGVDLEERDRKITEGVHLMFKYWDGLGGVV